jgi:hypothetical protein
LEKIVEYKVSFSDDYDEAFESTIEEGRAIENAFNLDINDPTELEQKAKRSTKVILVDTIYIQTTLVFQIMKLLMAHHVLLYLVY